MRSCCLGVKVLVVTRNSIKLSVQINRSARPKTSFDDSEGEEIIAADLGNTYLLLCECSEDQILKKEVVEADGVAHKHIRCGRARWRVDRERSVKSGMGKLFTKVTGVTT